MIWGCLCIKMAKSMLSTYHFVMIFPIKIDVREVRGNQIMAKECYFATIKENKK